MAILTHGSDMRLAPTLTPLVKQTGGTVRGALAALSEKGFTAAQLDATLPGVRPRELDQRARRDLAGTFVRSGVQLAGLDLFIPPAHFAQSDKIDRAMAATLAGIQLAADLGRLPLSLALAPKELSDDAKTALVEAADGCGIRLAIHAEHQFDDLLAWVKQVDLPILGIGLDPVPLLAGGQDPAQVAARHSAHLVCARLGDWQSRSAPADGQRCAPGSGNLDLIPYRMTLDLATGRAGPVVLDLTNLTDPLLACSQAARAWDQAAFSA
ncbi:MAG: hypothetical protein IT443_10190 [Phycisphaeraceae bacterium]|nr:hypothetical protein [Phycisphaeraceae bacterium]